MFILPKTRYLGNSFVKNANTIKYRTASSARTELRIYEVGPRDGLQNEAKFVPTEIKIELINKIAAAGIKDIESASFVSPKWVKQMSDSFDVMKNLIRVPGVNYPVLIPNLKGYESAKQCNIEEIAIFPAGSEGFSQNNLNCSVEEGLKRFKLVADQAVKDGIRVRGYVSCVLGCPYDGPIHPKGIARSKLTSYRDLQEAGKELNSDQKVAVAKYDGIAQTLEFARDLSKQVTLIATAAECDAKKQAKKEAWLHYTIETTKIREVLLILDCLMQMGNTDAREDFLKGTNGAAKLTEEDLQILDNLYPEVTPKHKFNEEGQAGFHTYTMKAAEHLYAIIDGKPKEVLGTTYAHIKEIINTVHECGYFDKSAEIAVSEPEECQIVEEEVEQTPELEEVEQVAPVYAPPVPMPAPPAPAVVPAPGYPLRPLPPITLQEVEHAYFSQQYPQQRPISEVIGSQNFFFLQESEIDSPVGTPQPPILNQLSPPGPIPTQTFTNQHFVQIPGGRVPEPGAIPMPLQPYFPPHPEHAYQGVPMPAPMAHPQPPHSTQHAPPAPLQHTHQPPQVIHVEPTPPQVEEQKSVTPVEDRNEEESKESRSPERDDDRKTQGQGDGQNRFRRYRGGGGGRGSSNGFRGRGSYQSRQNNDGYHSRHPNDYQNRSKDGYQNRQYDGYQNRHGKDGYQSRSGSDAYYGNGDSGDVHHNENGGRDRYNDNAQSYQGGFKSRGRGGPRGGRGAPRGAGPRPHPSQYNRKPDNKMINYYKMSRALRHYYRVNILRKVQGERHCYQFLRNPTELKNIKNISLLRQQMSPTRVPQQAAVKSEMKEERCEDDNVDEDMPTDLSMTASEPWRKRARADPAPAPHDKHRISALIGDSMMLKREAEYNTEHYALNLKSEKCEQ